MVGETMGSGASAGAASATPGVGLVAVVACRAASEPGRFDTAVMQTLSSASAPTIEPVTIQKRRDRCGSRGSRGGAAADDPAGCAAACRGGAADG